MSELRWGFTEGLAHVLADDATDAATLVALCELTVPHHGAVPGGAPAWTCARRADGAPYSRWNPPEFGSMIT